MKKLFLLTVLLMCIQSVAAQKLLNYASGTLTSYTGDAPMPVRNVETLSDGSIRVTYLFSSAYLVTNSQTPNKYWWNIGGFGFSEDPTKAAIPMRIDTFVLPDRTVADLTIETEEYKEFSLYPLSNGKAPETGTEDDISNVSEVPTRIVGGIPTDYPVKFVEPWSWDTYRNNELFSVRISAIKSLGYNNTVRALTKLVYVVSFLELDENGGDFINDYSTKTRPDDRLLRVPNWMAGGSGGSGSVPGSGSGSSGGTVTPPNPDVITLDPSYIIYDVNKTYLILTTDNLKTATNNFAEWKRMQGYNVIVESRPSWTFDSAKETVDMAFETYLDFYHLLIVGDHNAVPGKKIESTLDKNDRFHYSDYYFSFYGEAEEEKISDITVGRIPGSNSEECSKILQKIISHEKNPSNYTNFLTSGQLLDKNFDGYEDGRNILTLEEIYSYIDSVSSLTPKRVYYTSGLVTPTHWNKDRYYVGLEIPSYLKKPDFTWSGTTADISNAIHSGCSMVAYRGEGSPTQWIKPSFKATDAASLARTVPVVLSMACRTGQYHKSGAFVKAFLGNNYGCYSIIAPTTYSYQGYDDALLEGMIDALWPNPGLIPQFGTKSSGSPSQTPEGLTEIGEVMNQGILRMGETFGVNDKTAKIRTQEMYHLFGDPSMMVHTQKWLSTNVIDVKWVPDGEPLLYDISIECSEPYYIGVYDKSAGTSERYLAQKLYLRKSNPDSCIVTVYKQNRTPRIFKKYTLPSVKPGFEFNPTINKVSSNAITCHVEIENPSETESRLDFRDNYGRIVRSADCTGANEVNVDISDLNSGIYVVSLIKDENIVDSKHFVK